MTGCVSDVLKGCLCIVKTQRLSHLRVQPSQVKWSADDWGEVGRGVAMVLWVMGGLGPTMC